MQEVFKLAIEKAKESLPLPGEVFSDLLITTVELDLPNTFLKLTFAKEKISGLAVGWNLKDLDVKKVTRKVAA